MNFGSRMGCHQKPERSFFFKGFQFPVCARCTGVLVGQMIAVIMIAIGIRLPVLVAVAIVVPMALDGGMQYVKICMSDNIRRVITGFFAGIGLTYIYFEIIVMIYRFTVYFLK